MKPMKAHRFKDLEKKVKFPFFLQPKLNGIRCLAGGGVMQSNGEEIWSDAMHSHIRKELAKLPPHWIVDGEIYKHGWSLQTINGAGGVNRQTPNDKTEQLEYHIFDVISTDQLHMTFGQRWYLLGTIEESKTIKRVETKYAETRKELETWHKHWTGLGYEGTMLRSDESYGFAELCGNKENRWSRLLKFKDWLDFEYEVLGFEYGDGKYEGMVGALKLEHEGKPFTAGSGLSDLQRDPNNLPKWVRVKYEMLSDTGVPLKPTIDFVSYE